MLAGIPMQATTSNLRDIRMGAGNTILVETNPARRTTPLVLSATVGAGYGIILRIISIPAILDGIVTKIFSTRPPTGTVANRTSTSFMRVLHHRLLIDHEHSLRQIDRNVNQ